MLDITLTPIIKVVHYQMQKKKNAMPIIRLIENWNIKNYQILWIKILNQIGITMIY